MYFNLLEKIGQSQDEFVLMSCGLESTLGIRSLEFTKSWWYKILNQLHELQELNTFASESIDEFSIWRVSAMRHTWIFMSALESLPLVS